ncbi:MAG: multicopper oxidase family protein [Myxococcales bacterium]
MRPPFLLLLPSLALLACKPAPPASHAHPAPAAPNAAPPAVAGEEAMLKEFAGAYPDEASPNGRVRAFELVAAEAELPLIDGNKLRVWAYNGQVPGPTLRIRLGETLRVRFVNRLPEPSTIHWHGIRLPNDMDGVPTPKRPAIPPGGKFTYEFTPKDAGTYWFHPHIRSSEQVERGLFGVLIVEDAQPPAFDREEVWVLDDWLLDETRQVHGRFNTRHDLAHDGRWGNVITVNGRTDTRLVLATGERVRLRMVNVANGRIFAPQFEGVRARVIAVDGLYLREPIPLTRFELAPGNRLDLELVADEETSRAFQVIDTFYAKRPNRLAELVVDGAVDKRPALQLPTAHVPAWRGGLELPVHQVFRLNARQGGEFGIEWTINDHAFAGHHHDHPAIVTLQRKRWYRLQFANDSYRLHPIHIHGMFFRLLARNGQPVDEPFFRDTVLVHGRETVDIALVPTDVGDWMMHCHILEHAEAGMMTMVAVTDGP